MHALATEGLTKDYELGFWRKRPYRALDGLTLSVEPGEVYGFLGPNGAGKTTTLKLLMQLVFPTSGRAEILGRPVGDLAVKRRIGYLPEQPYFYDYLTAEELLVYFAGLFGYGPAERRARVARLLDEVGIGRERRLQLRKFSKGMLQRVGIAQALINDPELVIFDEPMSGLDPLGRRDVRALILRLRDRGCTVFFSSHVLSDAEALCSRVAILAKGRLITEGRLHDMLAFAVHGWELVAASVSDALAKALEAQGRVVRIGDGRYTIELPLDPPPDRVLAEIAAAGAALVSLNPLRETLEDFFVKEIQHDARGVRAAGEGTVRPIGWIAVNVFRESVRDKVLYNLVAFAILMIGASYLIGQLTAGQDVKIIKDLGLAAISIFGLFISVFIGIGLVSKEVERKSIYGLLSKPVERYQIVLGKFAGLVLTLAVNLAVMTAALYTVLLIMWKMEGVIVTQGLEASMIDPAMLKAVVLTFGELSVVTAIALFFSTFSTPLLSAAFTAGLWVAGRFSADLRAFNTVVDSPAAAALARGLYWVLPNFAPFDVRAQVVHAQPVTAGYMALTLGYGVLYTAALLAAAILIFSRRDFK